MQSGLTEGKSPDTSSNPPGVKSTRIIAVGGGKGGVGKSLVSSGISTSLALEGFRTVCVDLDLGGANLHTFFGIRNTAIGLGDFLYHPSSRKLRDYTSESGVANLEIISGNGFIPGIANLYYFQKLKILRAVKELDHDFVILDLGAGTSYNVIDFFSVTRSGIIVTNAEPTSILNAYEFIKNVLFRILTRRFKKESVALDIIDTHRLGEGEGGDNTMDALITQLERHDGEAADEVRRICASFTPGIVLNMVSPGVKAERLAGNLSDICRQFLRIEARYLGPVPRDAQVEASLMRMENLMLARPGSAAAKALARLGGTCSDREAAVSISSEKIRLDSPSEEQKRKNGETRNEQDTERLAEMLSSFFKTVQEEEHGDSSEKDGIDPADFIEMDFRMEQEHLHPVFMKCPEYEFQDLTAPSGLKEAVQAVIAFSDYEEEARRAEDPQQRTRRLNEAGMAWMACGDVFLKAGQYQSACRAFTRAAALMRENMEAQNNSIACLIIQGEAEQALERIDSLESGQAAPPGLDMNHALAAFLAGKYERAAENLEKILKLGQGNERIFLLWAAAQHYMGNYEQALELLRTLEPSPSVLYNRGVLLLMTCEWDRAADEFQAALRLERNDTSTRAALAVALLKKGDPSGAEEQLSRAIASKPANVAYRAARAALSFNSGMLDRAIEDAELISRLRPGNPGYSGLIEAIRSTPR